MEADAIVAGLDPDQYRAVTAPARTIRVLAGAGSGKTRVLTRRLAYRAATEDLLPGHALVLTFTRKAAHQLRTRLAVLGLRDQPVAGTFHGVAYAQLRTRWADRNRPEPSFVDNRYAFVRRMLGNHPAARQASALSVEIDWARARRIRPEGYAAAAGALQRRPALGIDTTAELFDRYEKEKRSRRSIDFDDVLEQCIEGLNRDSQFAEAQRWRFRHLFVDELQDVNPLQFALLRAWLGTGDDLCVVGDPNQAIYGWNGAEPDLLENLEHHLHVPIFTTRLRRNHRSTPEIVEMAVAALEPSLREQARMTSEVASGPLAVVRGCENDADEMTTLVKALREHHTGQSWGRQAVLVRTNGLAMVVREALEAASIPSRVRGTYGLTDDPVIKKALARLDASHDLTVGAADLEMEADPASDGDALRNLARLVRIYCDQERTGTAKGFRRWLHSSGRADDDFRSGGVEIATFHGAKGLEWPVVHICGVEAGFVPIVHAKTPAEYAEERRLLYVALTRAQERVLVSWAYARDFGGTIVERKPSPYLTDIIAADATLAVARTGGPGPVAAIAAIRRSLRPAVSRLPDPAERAHEALAVWRANVAKAAKVEPGAILHDDVLTRLAELRPDGLETLSKVRGVGPIKARRYGAELLEVLR